MRTDKRYPTSEKIIVCMEIFSFTVIPIGNLKKNSVGET